MSCSHLTVLQPSYFLWGSLAWCRDRNLLLCAEHSSAESISVCCLWRIWVLLPRRDGLLCAGCHWLQQGPCRAMVPLTARAAAGHGCQNIPISMQRVNPEPQVISPDTIPAPAATRGSCITYRNHKRVFSPEHAPNRAIKSCFLTTGLSQHTINPKFHLQIFINSAFPVT